jgi:hypothetical protein
MRSFFMVLAASLLLIMASPLEAQEVPDAYRAVLTSLGKTGDFKDNVLKVNIPRGDLKVTIKGRSAPTPFGFGGWVAMTTGSEGHDVMMGTARLLHACARDGNTGGTGRKAQAGDRDHRPGGEERSRVFSHARCSGGS